MAINKLLLQAIMAILVVLVPIKMVLVTVGVLIISDMILGVWASLKRKERFTSARLSDTVKKMFVYNITIITGFLMQSYILDDCLPVCKIIASIIATTEIKSLLENAESILGTPMFKRIKILLKTPRF